MKIYGPVKTFICKCIPGYICILITFVIVSPSVAGADWREFIPRPYENGAEIELSGSYETDDLKGSAQRSEYKDLFIKEKMTVFSDGYVYHPRFILYHLSLSGAIKQENFRNSFTEPSWTNVTGTEYNVSLLILPEHPYNLRLFSFRLEPIYRQEFSTQTNNVENSQGASFRYKKKPFFFSMKYIKDSLESSSNTTNTTIFGVSGVYFKEYSEGRKLSLSSAYDHASFSSSSSSSQTGTSDNYSLDNGISLKFATLGSSLSYNTFHQEGTAGPSDEDHFSWNERLTIALPFNFRTLVSYRYDRNSNSVGTAGIQAEEDLSDRNRDFELDVIHKLFQSLDTTYTVRRDSRVSSAGDATLTSNSLTSNYSKQIPSGILLAGINLNRTISDNSGTTDIVNEPHPSVAVPGSFVLLGQSPDPATIRVFLKNPLPPFEPVLLEEPTQYTATPFGNSFQITIISLPSQFVPVGTYDFSVSYALVAGNFKLQTDTYGFNVNLNLFNNLINPYYTYSSSTSKLLSGTLTGVPPDDLFTTLGVLVQKPPLRVLGEYQNSDSNINPYKQWKGEIGYDNAISDTSRIFFAGVYAHRRYPQGTSTGVTQAYTEKTTTLAANIRKQFLDRSLVIAAGGGFSSFQGLTKSKAYSLTSSLEWLVGKIAITLGASGYMSKSEGTANLTTERIHQFYYLNIKRKLF